MPITESGGHCSNPNATPITTADGRSQRSSDLVMRPTFTLCDSENNEECCEDLEYKRSRQQQRILQRDGSSFTWTGDSACKKSCAMGDPVAKGTRNMMEKVE